MSNYKSNYKKSLIPQFEKFNVEHLAALAYQEEAAKANGESLLEIYKVAELPEPVLLSYAPTPWKEEQIALKKANKADNEQVAGYSIDSADGKKITIKVPKRMKGLTEDDTVDSVVTE